MAIADVMQPAVLFGHAGTLAMIGWLSLIAGIALRRPWLRDRVAGLGVPVALSLVYTAIIAGHWVGSEGGFDSLDQVVALFRSDWLLLAGWVHYLAYDLFIGAWIARDADRRGLPRLLLVPVLPLAFLFGPGGLVLWMLIRLSAPQWHGNVAARS